MAEGRMDRETGMFNFDVKEELQGVTDRWLDEVDKGAKEAKMTEKDIEKIRERQIKLAEDTKRAVRLRTSCSQSFQKLWGFYEYQHQYRLCGIFVLPQKSNYA